MMTDVKTMLQGGRWATSQLKKAILEGKNLSTKALRTLDTLRHEEWKYIDDALLAEAPIRLVAVGDLVAAGLTQTIPNAFGKLVYAYEKITDMDEASVSLDGMAATPNDGQEFQFNQMPLPITHKDFFLNLRHLAASRNSGEPIDTTQIRTAGRVVTEKLEYLLINGYPNKFQGMPIYGYTSHPDRHLYQYTDNKSWSDPTKAGEDFLADLIFAKRKLAADRAYGPFFVYIPSDASANLDADFKDQSDKTIRQRLLEVEGIKSIKTADQLASGSVVLVQATMDTACWLNGEDLQTIQWDEAGGMKINFKAMAIGLPLVRSDVESRCGVFHFDQNNGAETS